MEMAEDESRVRNEVNPQEVCNEYQHMDKKNGFSMKMVKDQTCESRVEGNEVNPQEFLTSTSTGTRRTVSA